MPELPEMEVYRDLLQQFVTHCTITFNDSKLYFHGLRLSYLRLYKEHEVEQQLEKLGPNPFDGTITADKQIPLFAYKRRTLKTTLANLAVLAGIGNCYSDEICLEAQVLPLKKAMQVVFADAIAHGGSMDYPSYAVDSKMGR